MQHPISPSTHTVELNQLSELAERLAALPAQRHPSAAELEVPDAPAAARLIRLSWHGPPSFPYIWGYFGAGQTESADGSAVTELHTVALVRLSRILGLRHVWGVGH